MKEIVRNILPDIVHGLAVVVYALAKVIGWISTLLSAAAVSLHMLFNTEKGKKYRAYETQMRLVYEGMMQMAQAAQAQASAKQSFQDDSNRLLNNLKTNQTTSQELPKNVIQLEKKKDDPTDSNS